MERLNTLEYNVDFAAGKSGVTINKSLSELPYTLSGIMIAGYEAVLTVERNGEDTITYSLTVYAPGAVHDD